MASCSRDMLQIFIEILRLRSRLVAQFTNSDLVSLKDTFAQTTLENDYGSSQQKNPNILIQKAEISIIEKDDSNVFSNLEMCSTICSKFTESSKNMTMKCDNTLCHKEQSVPKRAAVTEEPVQKHFSQKNPSKKEFSRKYALSAINVCREMFCRTLQISPGRINTALKKYRMKSVLMDQRGLKQGGYNRLPTEKRNSVIRFFKRIPAYKSHYRKEKNRARYLPPDITLTKLYELYREEEKDNAGIVKTAKTMQDLDIEIMRTIYISMIESIVLYASCAGAPLTRKLGMRLINSLEPVLTKKLRSTTLVTGRSRLPSLPLFNARTQRASWRSNP
ncbi:hypothetical protein EVAR_18959_1 [Eumeta japonica]|uniref:Uncharacterized protein n=1 Tax=Eumeta variegata TaxID=151549 RepID=A0A4C1WW56_EUMVA|nr:hypothetical protein EVAR_18959_1 [Eumeta japonica]